ncbi:thioredoxin family protein [bacterium]|nr:thioredoxin family protein [bacterium]
MARCWLIGFKYRVSAIALGLILLAVLGWGAAAFAQNGGLSDDDPVKVSLDCDQQALRPGQSFTLRLAFAIAPGYHIYGPQPGDIGQPTQAEWGLPAGAELLEERWSEAEETEQDGFRCALYSERAEAVAVVKLADTLKPGQMLTFKVAPRWLVCGTMCVPGQAELALERQVVASDNAAGNSADSVDGNSADGAAGNAAGNASDGGAAEANKSGQTVPTAGGLPNAGASQYAPLSGGLLAAIVLAFAGGIILNLMPCVFPVLSIKALELVQASQSERGAQRRRVWAYSAGILLSFWLMAIALNVLRAYGHKLGWGFQMQSPYFVITVAYIFMALALNLFGLYEIGLGLTQYGESGSHERSSFVSGVLAVIVATPCTAPFMGTALGYAFTVPWYENLLVFTALGCGLALPLMLLAFWPAWQRLLPRPGAWMVTLRQALAFPLLLAAVYFAWVIDVQTGPYVAAAVLAGWVLLGMAVWIYGRWGQYGARWLSALALVLALLGWGSGCYVYYYQAQRTISVGDGAAQRSEVSRDSFAEGWSERAVREAVAAGRPVFIDFGASWCLTCQVNERNVLSDERVREAFKRGNVLFLKADWTNNDADITAALESFGRSGVPLYVYYNGQPDAQPQLLPELLTVDGVLKVLEKR